MICFRKADLFIGVWFLEREIFHEFYDQTNDENVDEKS